MTGKPVPTEEEIERERQAAEVFLVSNCGYIGGRYAFQDKSSIKIARLISILLATVRAEGRAEQDKHWTEVAQQCFEHVRPWGEMTGGFDDVAQFVLHEVWKRDPRVQEAKAEGAREEREAVVRFLLERVAFRANGIPSHENIAEKIERGDHLKGDR